MAPSQTKIIGFLGGSFDPIHFGHLNLAIQMVEKGYVDEVLFCPVFCSPFKVKTPPVASGIQRLEMIQEVIRDIPQFRVTGMEIEKEKPSFTIETLRALPKNECSYRLILSQESATHFDVWKESNEILQLAPPLVGLRGDSISTKFSLIEMPLYDISSTEIRQRLKKKLYCEHLVPIKALDYIAKHGLYCSQHE